MVPAAVPLLINRTFMAVVDVALAKAMLTPVGKSALGETTTVACVEAKVLAAGSV